MGQDLKTLRKSADLSIRQVELALGVSRQTLRRWETGRSRPNLTQLCGLLELYGAMDQAHRLLKAMG